MQIYKKLKDAVQKEKRLGLSVYSLRMSILKGYLYTFLCNLSILSSFKYKFCTLIILLLEHTLKQDSVNMYVDFSVMGNTSQMWDNLCLADKKMP